jgi:hypothetical protein
MSTRTKEEIERELDRTRTCINNHQSYIDAHNANIARLEAELSALPVEPVVLVARDRLTSICVHAEGDDGHLVAVYKSDCARHNIDPALLAREVAASQVAHALIELVFFEDGSPRGLSKDEYKRFLQLAARYFAALAGEVKP